jgi:hypothetical protein
MSCPGSNSIEDRVESPLRINPKHDRFGMVENSAEGDIDRLSAGKRTFRLVQYPSGLL